MKTLKRIQRSNKPITTFLIVSLFLLVSFTIMWFPLRDSVSVLRSDGLSSIGESKTSTDAQLIGYFAGGDSGFPLEIKCKSKPYRDIAVTRTFCAEIAWMSDMNIEKSSYNSNFGANSKVRRYEMALYIYRFTHGGSDAPSCSSNPFYDIGWNYYYCGAVKWTTDKGIIQASGNYFYPNNYVNRRDLALMMFNLANPNEGVPSCTSKPFVDVQASDSACGAIAWMVDEGITDGYEDGGFHPNANQTRQAVAAFLYRYSVNNPY